MKKLYLIGGSMGVGKTTVCQLLKKKLNNAVFLDGDWCWDADPFVVTEETKQIVIDNICHVLNNFICCSEYENVIFCWVMHEQNIIDELLSKLYTANCDVKVISLVCNPTALSQRLEYDIESGKRNRDVVDKSIERLHMYEKLNSVKIDVSELSPNQVMECILKV